MEKQTLLKREIKYNQMSFLPNNKSKTRRTASYPNQKNQKNYKLVSLVNCFINGVGS